nr:MAG TPA: hypothetical protein [Bacteriophage sp.]
MDAYLIVDPDSRNITIPEIESAFGVYGDNNAERKYFKSPRIVGNGIDLTECYLYVNYISASTKIGQILCDVGDAPNGTATEDEIVFSWPITRNVLDKNVSGEIFFAVQAKTKTGDTVFTTRKAKGNCYESIEGTEAVAEEYADIVLQLISRMDKVEENIGEQVAAYFKENPAVTSEYLTQTLQPIKDDVGSIKEDVDRKVDGNVLYNSNNVIVETGKLFTLEPSSAPNGKKLVFRNYSDGTLASVRVGTAKKAKITGFGWESKYKYFLYVFTDVKKNVISFLAHDSQPITDFEIDIPDNAYMLYVNGNTSYSKASIQIYSKEINFDDNFIDAYKRLVSKTNPKLLTLGDSITMLGTSDRGWIKYFIEKTNCKLIANVAMNSAVLSDYSNTEYDGNPQQNNQTNNVLGNQVQKIINNNYEAPDIIMIAIGTNGGINITKDDIKNAYYDSSNNLILLEDVDRRTNAGAYRYATEKLHKLYPNAIIFWCTPIMGYQKTRSAENAVKYAESLRIATEYSGQIMIDTIRCGINGVNEFSGTKGEYLQDGLHPSIDGAKKIGYYNAAKVLPFIGILIN